MDKKNLRIVYASLSVLIIMLLLTAASPPLYKLYCSATGYGGSVRVYKKPSKITGTKNIIVHLDTSVDSELKWEFKPLQHKVDLITGENKLAFYKARNLTDKSIVGMAIYNVTPNLAGQYFNKVECFCFARQTLGPNQEIEMPLLFHIDPKIENDPDLKNIKEITLSYKFYKIE